MAEVADLHISLDGFEEEEIETLGSISCWPYEFEHEDIYSSDSDPDLDDLFSSRFAESDHFERDDIEEQGICIQNLGSEGSDSDSVTELNHFTRHDRQVNLVSDLFEQCDEETHIVDDPFFRVVDENNEMDSNYLDLGLGLGRVDEEHDDENGDFMIDECSGDFFVGLRNESGESSESRNVEPFGDGLRVVGIGSDSDEEVEEGILGVDFRSCDEDGLEQIPDDLDSPLCWDCLRLEDQRENNDFYEWEEVDDRIEERDVLTAMMEYEERSASASTEIQEVVEGREEAMRNLEWEVLLQVHNLERNAELDHDFDHDDYIHPAEYELFFGQFTENANALRGSPPAAKTVVENLPSIVLTQDDMQKKDAICAVCKDDIPAEEQAKLLPCSHYYHGDCILPWLNIRNTCPVCRFELPTDDLDYEQRRTQRAGHGSSGVSQVRYNFQMFPEE